jgi:hypothetical protein
MYVTSATGLGIYDVSRPEAPQRLSRLPLTPHPTFRFACPLAPV